jgi:ABC-type bacteriocin/lantibiotic exporter with double-glycine peptidase domain
MCQDEPARPSAAPVSSEDAMRRIAFVLLLGALFAGDALAATINVPFFRQKTSNDCGRAALASLAARKGGSAERHYALLPAPSSAAGYSISDMRRLGPRVGVSLSVTAPAGIVIAGECSPRPPVTAHMKRLAAIVSGGTPVVVPVSVWFGSGHYYVLVGADGGGFTALDPASPGLKRFSTSELAGKMCDYGYVALVAR